MTVQHDRDLADAEASLATNLAGMRRLYDLQAKLAGERDLRAALEAIVDAANAFLATDRGCIQLVSEDGARLEMYAWRGWDEHGRFVQHFLRGGSENACDAARRNRQRLIIEDIEKFQPLAGTADREVALAEAIRATQHTPVFGRNGDLLGVLSSQFRKPHRPSDEQLEFIDMLAWTAAGFIERHKAEKSLREAGAQLAVAMEIAQLGHWELDLATQKLDASLQCKLNFGRNPGQPFDYADLREAIHPDDRDMQATVVQAAIESRSEFTVEYRLYTPSGELRWACVRGRYDQGPHGPRLIGVSTDVTARMSAEDAMRESEERQAFLLKFSDALRLLDRPEAIREETARQLGKHLKADRAFYAEINEQGEACFAFDYCSPRAQSMAGCLRLDDFGGAVAGDLRAGHVLVVPDVEAWDALGKAEKRVFASCNIRALVKVPLIRQGKLAAFFALQQARPRAWTHADVALVADVAERTWSMVERANAEEARRISDEKYRSLFDNADEGFCVMELEYGKNGTLADLRFREVNRAFGRQTGLHDVLGKSVREFMPDFETRWARKILRVMRTGEPAHVQDRQNDNGRWFSASYSRVGGKDSRLLAVVFEDTTDRVRHEIALRDNQARLLQANRAKDDFIAMLGHELRNPLAPIVNTLQLMKLRAPDVLVKERGIIDAQARYLTELVDDLLDASRFARGEIKLKTGPVDMADVVGAAVETVSPLLEEHRQKLETDVPPGCIVEGDRRRLIQIVVNLLSNSAKYSPPDRNVRLDVACKDQQMTLRVQDQGQGIAPELLPHVFEMFTQESQTLDRSRGGLGLGLAIVRNLVDLHGGSVEATSEGRGKGATFCVRLPLQERRRSNAAPATHDASASQAATDTTAKQIRVLIIDDYALAADSLSMLLTAMGYHTQVAYDGVSGVDALDTFHPDVALIDIGLPLMNGYEVAHRVRSMDKYRNLPLVAVTGYGQPDDIARAKQAGFDEHLVKPLNAGKIGELIERLVGA
ncbi:MAG TPA: ATP-binding protein [Rhodanobacteraceae bacterium]